MLARALKPLSRTASSKGIANASVKTGLTRHLSRIENLNMDTTPYQLSFYVPKDHTSTVLAAIHKTGAGIFPGGLYGECAFISPGTGTFRPLQGANPNIGSVGEVEKVSEDKVELMCFGKHCVIDAVEALKKAHPYEQVAYFVVKGEDI